MLCASRQLRYDILLAASVLFFLRLPYILLQLRAALDEYTQAGTRQDRQFEYNTYSKICAGYMDMQRQIDQAPKHAAKTKELRVAWASGGK